MLGNLRFRTFVERGSRHKHLCEFHRGNVRASRVQYENANVDEVEAHAHFGRARCALSMMIELDGCH